MYCWLRDHLACIASHSMPGWATWIVPALSSFMQVNQVIAYNRTERLVITFTHGSCESTKKAKRFLFVGAALALTSHFGTLVVPAQAGIRPLFSYSTSGATVHGYRFAVSSGAGRLG